MCEIKFHLFQRSVWWNSFTNYVCNIHSIICAKKHEGMQQLFIVILLNFLENSFRVKTFIRADFRSKILERLLMLSRGASTSRAYPWARSILECQLFVLFGIKVDDIFLLLPKALLLRDPHDLLGVLRVDRLSFKRLIQSKVLTLGLSEAQVKSLARCPERVPV